MDGSAAEGWEAELERWLGPFLARLGREEQRRWAPFYLKGLILPGERKSVEPMAARVAPADTQQLHHFVSASPWATAPLEDELVKAADRLVGGPDAALVVDDTALVKQGRRSVGVKRQYCGQLGKKANCQALVSLTLARGEVPVGVGLRLFLPEDWCGDVTRRAAAGVPDTAAYRPKWRIALDEIDRVLASGARSGAVLGDAEYGRAAEFRARLAGARGGRSGCHRRTAPPRGRGVARRRASDLGRAQVLPLEPAARRAARDPGRPDQGPVGVRADAPAARGRARAGPLRGPGLA